MARQASGAVYVDVGPNLNFFRKQMQAQFKVMKPFTVPVQGKWAGFAKGFAADARAAARKRGFTVPVKAAFGGFAKGFKQDLRAAWKKYSENLSVPIKMGVDTKGVTPALKETQKETRRTADDTDKLSGKFKAFGLITGLAAPKVIAFAAAFPGLVLGITNASAALVPLVGIVAAAPAVLGAGAVALGVYKLATAGFGDAIGALMKGDGKKWDEYLKKLSPNARAAAQAIATMKPQLKGVQQAVQDRFFAGFAEDLRLTGQKYLPLLRSQLPPVAASMSGFVENFAAGARQAPGFQGVRDIITATGTSLARANDNMRPFTSAVLSMGTAGAPSVNRLGDAFANGTGKLATFISRSVAAGAAQQWIDDAVDTGKVLWGILKNVGSVVYSIFSAGNTQGGGFLVTLRDLTGEAASFLRTAQGAAGLQAFFGGLSAIGGALGDVVGDLLPALGSAFVILAPAVKDAAPALADVAKAAVPLVPALAKLAVGVLPPLVDILQVLTVPLTWVATGLGVIFGWMGKNQLVSSFVAVIVTGVIAFKTFVAVMKVIAFVTKAWAVAQWILNAAWAANPIGVIVIGIIALGAVLVLAYKRSETFRNIVQATFRAIAAAGKWMWESVLKPAFFGIVEGAKAVGAGAMWLWNKAIKPAWDGIAAGSKWLWTSVIKPVWGFISAYFKVWWTVVKAIFTAVGWFLSNFIIPWFVRVGEVVQIYWKLVGTVISWVWTTLIKPVFDAVSWYITNVVAPVWGWLYNNVIKPAFDGISAVIGWWWNHVTMPIFNAVVWYVKSVIIPGFQLLWSIAKSVWDGIGGSISWVWKNVIKPVFDFLKDAVVNKIPAAFRAGKDAVGKAWEGIKDIAKAPIKFVIETVINDGIIGAYNWVASKFGVKKADKVPLPKGFAAGGVLPGYTPGRDVHRFFSPTGGLLDLSGGEAIMRPEFTKAIGPGKVFALNAAAREGGPKAVQEMARAMFSATGGDEGNPPSWRAVAARVNGKRKFALGGVFGKIGDAVSGFAGDTWKKIKSVADVETWIKKLVNPLIDSIPGAAQIRDLAVGGAKKMLDGVVSWAKGKSGEHFQSSGAWSGFIPPDKAGRIAAAQEWAKGAAGTPYRYGGAGAGGFDCSAAVSAVYNILQGKGPWSGVRFTTANEGNYMNTPGPSWFYAKWIAGNKAVAHTKGWIGNTPFEQTPEYFRVGKHVTPDSYFNRTGHPQWATAKDGGVFNAPATYDEGGVLKPGRTLTYNGTGKPEAILTEKQWRIMQANKKNGGDKHYQFNIKNPKDKPTPKTIMDTLKRNELVYGDD